MATTTNFGWETPDDTDLVKDGAAAIRTALGGVDTSFVDLKGGTSGQVLSKASNTDLDFTWVAQDDSNAIQNAIVDAKGDLIAATAADTPARLAVGTNGQVLTADSTAATGLAWTAPVTGGMTLLSTTTMSGSTTTVSSISQAYTNLYVVLENVTVSVDAEVSFRIVSSSTLHFQYYLSAQSTTVGQVSNGSGTLTGGANMDDVGTGGMGNWSMTFNNYSVGKRFGYSGQGVFYKPSWCGYWFGGGFESTTPLSSLAIVASNSATLGGIIKIYGVK